MDYLSKYGEAMDFVRNVLGVNADTNNYEVIVRFVDKYKEVAQGISTPVEIKKEKRNVGRPKKQSIGS